jgi:outer membrane protein OmpA-like peptidoglycan-associated protein/ABC-type nitrate/sulfonate/bicarbonate transport system substrate-binding protein
MNGQPKAPFYVALFLVVAGLLGFAVYRSNIFAPPQPKNKVQHGGGAAPGELDQIAEDKDSAPITTLKEYTFKPMERLPDVKGTSAYKPLEDNTVRFALNVWAGWGPIILANDGFKPGKEWTTKKGDKFKIELVLIDNPVAMRDAYAAGEVHIGWATLDMVPLFMEGFVDKTTGQPKDSRIMPRIYQQVDWSNGGDGIVAREAIKTVSDLRGKNVVLAQNSPSHYFLLNMLVSGGVQPNEVEMIFTEDAFQAAAAFNARKDLGAAVSWAPDIYNLADAKGNRMLVNTQTANKLIADVWFARADFAKDHVDKIESIVRGIFDAMEDLKKEDKKAHAAKLMADGYNIPATETIKMFGDAHSTNWAENYQFFMNQNNPANFERVWKQAYYLYRRVGAITHQPVSFDKVMDFSVIEALGKEAKYRSQKDEYQQHFVPKTVSQIPAESDEILTNTIVIQFFPNSWDLYKKINKDEDGKTIEVLYDPNVDNVLDEVAKLTAQFGAARIVVEGHTDSSRRGQVPESMVKELSLNRANSVRESLVNKYKMDPNRFAAAGWGWDRPADPNDPENQAKNRRVEIKVYSAEKQ